MSFYLQICPHRLHKLLSAHTKYVKFCVVIRVKDLVRPTELFEVVYKLGLVVTVLVNASGNEYFAENLIVVHGAEGLLCSRHSF
jgi:hypothetical protein